MPGLPGLPDMGVIGVLELAYVARCLGLVVFLRTNGVDLRAKRRRKTQESAREDLKVTVGAQKNALGAQ